MAEDRFDGMFLTVAQQAQGIEPLMDAMFSFLRRKTDFFTGASQEKIESLVLGIIRKQATLSERDLTEKKAAAAREEKKKREKMEKAEKKRQDEEAAARAAKAASVVADDVLELSEDGTFDVSSTLSTPKPPTTESAAAVATLPPAPVAESTSNAVATESSESAEAAESEEDKGPPCTFVLSLFMLLISSILL